MRFRLLKPVLSSLEEVAESSEEEDADMSGNEAVPGVEEVEAGAASREVRSDPNRGCQTLTVNSAWGSLTCCRIQCCSCSQVGVDQDPMEWNNLTSGRK